MSYRDSLPSFSSGEVSAKIADRFDVAKRQTALERARNVLILPEGGVYNRAGFEFVDRVVDYTKLHRLIDFFFTVEDSYALEFGDETMRVMSNGAPVTRPLLVVTGITKAASAVVTAPDHGYQIGWRVQLSGIEGMVEINGMIGTVTAVTTDTVTLDIDSTAFSTYTGSVGGVAGDVLGGTGGEPPTPTTTLPGLEDAVTPPTTTDPYAPGATP
jgi:hypothetical protein